MAPSLDHQGDEGVRVDQLVRQPPLTLGRAGTMTEAARLMDEHGVGMVVVVEHGRPVGVVTDRDITVRGTARRYPTDARIDSVMTTEVTTLAADADPRQAVDAFRSHPVRRLPLVDDRGRLVGILGAEDLLVALMTDLAGVAQHLVDAPGLGSWPPVRPA